MPRIVTSSITRTHGAGRVQPTISAVTAHGSVGLVTWGVNPAPLANYAARRNRLTSPISATNTAATTGLTPEMA
jgi:hypothetical protein